MGQTLLIDLIHIFVLSDCVCVCVCVRVYVYR